jgi:hypothetical protein
MDIKRFDRQLHPRELLSSLTPFSGANPKVRKVTISSVMPIRRSERVEQLRSYWTDVYEIWYASILRRSLEKIQVSLKA